MKKLSIIHSILLMFFFLTSAGCDSNNAEDPEDVLGSFEIQITGDVTQTFNGGQAAFGASTDVQTGITGFGLSIGATGTTTQSLVITRKGPRPGNGTHAVANFDLTTDIEGISDDTFIAIYSSGTDVYYSSGGSFTITESTDTRLEGNINFTARSVISDPAGDITVSGSFTAIGLDLTGQ